jgi:Thioesterase-like superfamily
MSALFTTAMTLQQVDAGVYPRVFEGELNNHWTIGPKVHGGAMPALCANAARTACGGPSPALEPVAVSANFLWAPDPGPMRLVTSIRKRGRRISVVDVELTRGDRAAVHAVVNLGEPEHFPRAAERRRCCRRTRGGPDGTGAAGRRSADRARPPAGRPGALPRKREVPPG